MNQSTTSIVIRKPKLAEHNQWHELWLQYLVFYNSEDFSPELTDLLWLRIQNPDNPINCFVIERIVDSELLGFVNFSGQVSTWQEFPICYLEDLFVLPETRGQGLGNKLIDAVVEHAKEQQWQDVYWQTQFDNEIARGLYDKITGGTDGYVIYRIETKN